MRQLGARNRDDLDARMLVNEWLGGALTFVFQALIVATLFLGQG
ncbi:MAG TPA: hypothetical protein VIW02_02920 [Gammaproteobacteria bacterium]